MEAGTPGNESEGFGEVDLLAAESDAIRIVPLYLPAEVTELAVAPAGPQATARRPFASSHCAVPRIPGRLATYKRVTEGRKSFAHETASLVMVLPASC